MVEDIYVGNSYMESEYIRYARADRPVPTVPDPWSALCAAACRCRSTPLPLPALALDGAGLPLGMLERRGKWQVSL